MQWIILQHKNILALEFQRSVEQSLEQTSSISSDIGASNTKRRKMAV
ncbi:DUF4756 family protein [Pectobacterium brasiliense]|nr:DUF4756 family protein [Pectobacterium brasiliense]MCA5934373.1 DUF4756 family protein [Pectobacterium brasiliense]MCA5938555.1 DUF4756 family protein [Pectobacterium brasiliense]